MNHLIFNISECVFLFLVSYLAFRIIKAGRLRLYMSELVHQYNIKRIDNSKSIDELKSIDCLSEYKKLPDLTSMIFSLKKLKMESFLDKKFLDKLLYSELNDILEQNKIEIDGKY